MVTEQGCSPTRLSLLLSPAAAFSFQLPASSRLGLPPLALPTAASRLVHPGPMRVVLSEELQLSHPERWSGYFSKRNQWIFLEQFYVLF